MQKCCPSCLSKLKNTYRKTKEFKPTKEMERERERIQEEHAKELVERFGVSNENCIKFRLQETNKDRGADWFNHLEICAECRKWMKNQGCDLNASSKKFAEHQGYSEFFQGKQDLSTMGENKKGMTPICHICGTPLEKDGSCPNRCCE
jgi:hypothetical protein